ncbi:MAG: hypothetical protein M1383_04500 [Patescibacteria group bacterium]|nr:hypothetical protein [Patescibacteria group bacterium]
MDFGNSLQKLKEKVFNRQKELGQIYGQYGHLSLAGYVKTWKAPGSTSPALLKGIGKLTEKYYGQKTAQGAVAQLKILPLASTIDHHGIFGHPFFLNSNLIFGLKSGINYLICLSTAGVSLNNSSWPGSMVLTDANTGRPERISFFPDRQKTQAVLATQALAPENFLSMARKIAKLNFLGSEQKQNLENFLENLFQEGEIFKLESFSRQASVLSSKIWGKIFPRAPKLIYLPVEELVSEILTEEILPDPGNFLHQLLFTLSGWDDLEKYYRGSLGAFSSGHKGSFLFWGAGSGRRRIRLARKKDILAGQDFALKLDPETFSLNLRNGKIYPTTLVCFLVLLSHNLACLGGFNQVDWLSNIKANFKSLLEKRGQAGLAGNIALVPAANFAEGNLAFLQNSRGRLYKATAWDLLLTGKDYWDKYKGLAAALTVEESIFTLLPEIYKIITPAPERDPQLELLTDLEVARLAGIHKKLESNH